VGRITDDPRLRQVERFDEFRWIEPSFCATRGMAKSHPKISARSAPLGRSHKPEICLSRPQLSWLTWALMVAAGQRSKRYSTRRIGAAWISWLPKVPRLCGEATFDSLGCANRTQNDGAHDRGWTGDLRLTKPPLNRSPVGSIAVVANRRQSSRVAARCRARWWWNGGG